MNRKKFRTLCSLLKALCSASRFREELLRTLKDDQFDRRKVEVRQRMEPKRTNSPIDFLRPEYTYHSVKSWQKLAFNRASGTERR